jgi:hypothetical protein
MTRRSHLDFPARKPPIAAAMGCFCGVLVESKAGRGIDKRIRPRAFGADRGRQREVEALRKDADNGQRFHQEEWRVRPLSIDGKRAE